MVLPLPGLRSATCADPLWGSLPPLSNGKTQTPLRDGAAVCAPRDGRNAQIAAIPRRLGERLKLTRTGRPALWRVQEIRTATKVESEA
jgi:hypothetical protein